MVPSPAPLQTNLAFWKNAVLWPDHHVQSHPTQEVGGTWPQPSHGRPVPGRELCGASALSWEVHLGLDTELRHRDLRETLAGRAWPGDPDT